MADPQQQSARVKGQVQRHVPGDGGFRCGQQQVDGGLSGEPFASLKPKLLATVRLDEMIPHRNLQSFTLQLIFLPHSGHMDLTQRNTLSKEKTPPRINYIFALPFT